MIETFASATTVFTVASFATSTFEDAASSEITNFFTSSFTTTLAFSLISTLFAGTPMVTLLLVSILFVIEMVSTVPVKSFPSMLQASFTSITEISVSPFSCNLTFSFSTETFPLTLTLSK